MQAEMANAWQPDGSGTADTAPFLVSTIMCRRCGYVEVETMLTDARQSFYDGRSCGATLRLKPGHCCVFCSYGSTPCPPMQRPDVNP